MSTKSQRVITISRQNEIIYIKLLGFDILPESCISVSRLRNLDLARWTKPFRIAKITIPNGEDIFVMSPTMFAISSLKEEYIILRAVSTLIAFPSFFRFFLCLKSNYDASRKTTNDRRGRIASNMTLFSLKNFPSFD